MPWTRDLSVGRIVSTGKVTGGHESGSPEPRTTGPEAHTPGPASLQLGGRGGHRIALLESGPKMCLYTLHLSRWLLSKPNQQDSSVGQGVEKPESPCTLVGCRLGQPLRNRTEGPPQIKQNDRVTQPPHCWVSVSRRCGSWVWRGRRQHPRSLPRHSPWPRQSACPLAGGGMRRCRPRPGRGAPWSHRQETATGAARMDPAGQGHVGGASLCPRSSAFLSIVHPPPSSHS